MRRDGSLALLIGFGGLLALSGLFHPFFRVPSLFGGWVAFTVAPGLPLALLLGRGERGWMTAARALFLGPLVTGVLATALLVAGADARGAGAIVAAFATGAALLALRSRGGGRWPRDERRLAVWMLVVAALVLLPHALREWVRWRSDAWFHTAVALEIRARGLPPGDPYFAGIQLHYLWFYHAILAVWSGLAGSEPWNLGPLLNAGWLASICGAVYALSRRLGRSGREALGAAVFVPLGLSALFTLWLPLKLARGLVGATTGPAVLRDLFGLTPFGFDTVHHVASTWGSVPPFLNKFWVMSAFGGAVAALAWLSEGIAELARESLHGRRPPRSRTALFACAAFGSWALHPASGLAATVALALLGLALLVAPGGIARATILRGGLAFALGTLAAAPWILASAGRADGPFPFGFDPWSARAVLVSSTAALLFGVPALARLRPGPMSRFARLLAAALAVAALVVVLPPPNTADKMAFVFYLPLGTAAGWQIARLGARLRRRGHLRLAWGGLGLLLVPATAFYLAALLLGRADPSPTSEERALYRWLAADTPEDAVVLDTAERDAVLVRVPRRQYWGREPYAVQWGYDADAMARRRLVRDAFVAAGDVEASWERVERALGELDLFAAEGVGPLYALWRPGDHAERPAEASVMGRRPDRFTPVWSNGAATVYRYNSSSGN